MYITVDFDKHIVFPLCAFFGKSAIDVHAAEGNQDKIHKKENVNEMLLKVLLFLWLQYLEGHRGVECVFTLKFTIRNSDYANCYSQISSAK